VGLFVWRGRVPSSTSEVSYIGVLYMYSRVITFSMKLFREYTMSWWQVVLLKVYVFVVGLIIGSYFVDVVQQYMTVLVLLFVALAAYFIYTLFTDGLGGN